MNLTTIEIIFERETKNCCVYKSENVSSKTFASCYIDKSHFPIKGSYPTKLVLNVETKQETAQQLKKTIRRNSIGIIRRIKKVSR